MKAAVNEIEGAMRPLFSFLGLGRLLAFPVHHVLAQAGPGQQEAQGAGRVQAGRLDHA